MDALLRLIALVKRRDRFRKIGDAQANVRQPRGDPR